MHVTVKVAAKPSNDLIKVQFDVTDTGIGIPEDKMNRLFKVFSQVDTGITRKYGGTGLGLAISKKLTALMCGDIWVTSVQGKGSTFSFSVPLSIASKPVSHTEITSPNPETWKEKAKLLIVEDNSANQLVARQILKRLGILRVTTVSDGKQAVEAVQKANEEKEMYDVILMVIIFVQMRLSNSN